MAAKVYTDKDADLRVLKGKTLAVLGFEPADPTGYGRLVIENDSVAAIVEERDASPEQRAIGVVNAGIYAANQAFLARALTQIDTNNARLFVGLRFDESHRLASR